MPIRARLLCHHCAVDLTEVDHDHYGYQCHDCVVREHELLLVAARDPEHPDVAWLETSPIDLRSGKRAGTKIRLRARLSSAA